MDEIFIFYLFFFKKNRILFVNLGVYVFIDGNLIVEKYRIVYGIVFYVCVVNKGSWLNELFFFDC